MKWLHVLVGFLVQVALSQVTNKVSNIVPGATITYKKTIVCGSVVSYSGYINLDSSVVPGAAYNASSFFWFFPARNPVGANLALYLAGGPGEASTFAALTENGPCTALPDGSSAIPNVFSFNQNAHVLYVDQPNQVGFSYDRIVDGAFNALGGFGSGDIEIPGAASNLTNIKGRFASQDPEATAKTSTAAAKSMWYFLQVFFADFEVNYGEKYSVDIWGNSYGGMYAAALSSYILRTNLNFPIKANATYKPIKVPSVGITNGCMDIEAQGPAYASLPYNNTFNNPDGSPFRIYSKEQSESILQAAQSPGSCFDQVQACRHLKASNDPNDEGTNETANTACATATHVCNESLLGPYFNVNGSRSQYDMGLKPTDPNPPKYAASYLNKPSTRDALGVPPALNYTLYSNVVFNNFYQLTGDAMRKGSDDIVYVLNQGTRVAMVYGDRDWRCNWLGAENLTLSLPWTPSGDDGGFAATGYVPLRLPAWPPRMAAVTRQHTLLSFTRVFDAGHAVSLYQPATVQAIFARVSRDSDIATGLQRSSSTVTRDGKRDSWGWRGVLGPPPVWAECSLWASGTCTAGQMAALEKGTAKVDGSWRVVWPLW